MLQRQLCYVFRGTIFTTTQCCKPWSVAKGVISAGQREAVEQEVLDTAAKFAKYAVAAYGQFGLKFKDEKG